MKYETGEMENYTIHCQFIEVWKYLLPVYMNFIEVIKHSFKSGRPLDI